METEYVTKAQYDAEITALKAEIDTLKAVVSFMQSRRSTLEPRSGLESRVADLEFRQRPLGAVGPPLPTPHRHPRET
jgi:hypothetical protein